MFDSKNKLVPTPPHKNAFTLAEVLITLVIIGVIAALTVPLIMSNYNKHVTEVRLKKFYSTINQAIRKSEIDNGDKRYWETLSYGFEKDDNGNDDTTKPKAKEWYEKYLAPYIITTKVEIDPTSKIVSYYPDGSLSAIDSNSVYFYPRAKDYHGTIEKDKCGKKFFTFLFEPKYNNSNYTYHYNKGVEPYAYTWDGTREMLLTKSNIGCNNNATNERAFCTMLIAINGWKIPDDYPLSF